MLQTWLDLFVHARRLEIIHHQHAELSHQFLTAHETHAAVASHGSVQISRLCVWGLRDMFSLDPTIWLLTSHTSLEGNLLQWWNLARHSVYTVPWLLGKGHVPIYKIPGHDQTEIKQPHQEHCVLTSVSSCKVDRCQVSISYSWVPPIKETKRMKLSGKSRCRWIVPLFSWRLALCGTHACCSIKQVLTRNIQETWR